MAKIRTKVTHPKWFENVDQLTVKAAWQTANELLNDSTEESLIPYDTSKMAKSGRVSKPQVKKHFIRTAVTFNTSYAQRQYYEHKTKSKWIEKAYKRNKQKYNKMMKSGMRGK